MPRFRRSLEAFGELLEGKALSAWGSRRWAGGGRLEASARYTWERLLHDGRVLDIGGEGGGSGGGSSGDGSVGDGAGWQVGGLVGLVCCDRMCVIASI